MAADFDALPSLAQDRFRKLCRRPSAYDGVMLRSSLLQLRGLRDDFFCKAPWQRGQLAGRGRRAQLRGDAYAAGRGLPSGHLGPGNCSAVGKLWRPCSGSSMSRSDQAPLLRMGEG